MIPFDKKYTWLVSISYCQMYKMLMISGSLSRGQLYFLSMQDKHSPQFHMCPCIAYIQMKGISIFYI